MIDLKLLRKLGIVLFCMLAPCFEGYSQPCDNDPLTPLPPCIVGPPPPNPVPISGIEILIGAGAWLGARRMKANRKTTP